MVKRALLARPHPFIVSEMKPWLERCGYETSKPEASEQIADLARASVGAVISLAVSSSLAVTAAEALGILRQVKPTLPIVFAALRTFSQVRPEIERLLQTVGVAGTIASVDEDFTGIFGLGSGRAFVYLSKDDLREPERAVRARALLTRHFV